MQLDDPPPLHSLRSAPLPFQVARTWPSVLGVVAIYFVWLVAWYFDTITSMVSIWYRSETFAHGFLVLPVSLWLIWRQRGALAELTPRPALAPLALALLVGAEIAWIAGELADVLAVRHFAWVTMLVAGVWLLIGNTIMRRLAFPLAFLYFAVPVGEFLLPTLIEWTADFTVAALRMSGVPVLRDGMTFQIPSGSWSVVEACSGLRYLIASLTVGVLYAYLSYRTLTRRLLFVAASIIVPIIANWLRAYMIVMIGHLSGNRLAVGIDHIIYGWIFFGVVMVLLFWIGGFWSDSSATATAADRAAEASPSKGEPAHGWRVPLVVALALTALPPGAFALLQDHGVRGQFDTTPPVLRAWQPVGERLVEWVPEFTAPRAAIASTYAKGAARGGLYVALYYDQDRESKLVSSRNQLMRTTYRGGHVISEGRRTVQMDGGPLVVDESVLRAKGRRLLVRNWFWIDGEFTASPARAKMLQALSRVSGRGDGGAIIVVWTLLPDAESAAIPAEAAATLDDLTRAAVETLQPVLRDRLRAGRGS